MGQDRQQLKKISTFEIVWLVIINAKVFGLLKKSQKGKVKFEKFGPSLIPISNI